MSLIIVQFKGRPQTHLSQLGLVLRIPILNRPSPARIGIYPIVATAKRAGPSNRHSQQGGLTVGLDNPCSPPASATGPGSRCSQQGSAMSGPGNRHSQQGSATTGSGNRHSPPASATTGSGNRCSPQGSAIGWGSRYSRLASVAPRAPPNPSIPRLART